MSELPSRQSLVEWKDGLVRSVQVIARGFNRLGVVFWLVLLILVFSFLSPPFRNVDNIIFLAKNTAMTIGIVAVGQTVVLLSGGIDLSVSSVVALTGLISAWLMKYGLGFIPPLNGPLCYLAILAGWLIGILIGAGQGWLITYRQMPAFIVTLGSMVGLRGLALALSKGAIIYGLPAEFKWFSNGSIAFIPAPVLMMLTIYGITAYILVHTKIGRYCHAIGGNETAARLAGIDVNRYRVYFYAYSGLLAAVTGTILISLIDAGVYTNGDGFQFTSVAAAILGGTSLTGGVGGIWGTLIGSFILVVIPSGMIMLNAPSWWRDVITGVVIILAIAIDVERQKTRKAAVHLEVTQPVPAGQYLHELLGKLAQRVEKLTGSSLCRVYLVDRETGDLVPQDVLVKTDNHGSEQLVLPGKSRIVAESKERGTRIVISDLSRGGYERLMPMRPGVQSALALPMFIRERCIGVLELQSPQPAAFKETTLDTLAALTQPIASALEDAWLFESGWLVRQARDALRHLWDDLYLGRTPLADWALPDQDPRKEKSAGARGEALRDLLIKTIECLKPEEAHDPAHQTRSYPILDLTYIQEQAVDMILLTLHISRRQYFYDLKDSIEILADRLVRDHQARENG